MDTANYADILFFALMAVFIGYRLYTTLGKHDGDSKGRPTIHRNAEAMADWINRRNQQPQDAKNMKQAEVEELKPMRTDRDNTGIQRNFSAPVQHALEAITTADEDFSVDYFLKGARAAYEMVLKAFTSGDKETLQMLLSPEVYQAFMKQFDSLKAQGYTEQVTLVSVDKADITQAALQGSVAQIEVAFVSQQVIVVKDANGRVAEGDPTQMERIEDSWLFQRDVRSDDVNWVIIST